MQCSAEALRHPEVLTVRNQQCSILEKSFSVSSAKLIFVSRVLQVRSIVADPGGSRSPGKGVLPCSHVCGLWHSSL